MTVPTVIIEIKNTYRGRKSTVDWAKLPRVASERTTKRSVSKESVPVGHSNRLRDSSEQEDI
jgi:hypothetical protein